MTDKQSQFKQYIEEGYATEGDYITFGTAMLDGEALQETLIKAPLKSLNRHGLIAGATGTGKTKTIQLIAEALSEKSIPVLLMDLKGDLSGLAKEGNYHRKIIERHDKIGIPFEPTAFPVELLTLSQEKGVRLRATVSEFGPILFSKMLELNDTQSGLVSLIFKYCDDKKLPLLDLIDFKKVLNYATNEAKKEIEKEYGLISTNSVGAILRRIIELEQQGAERFFGEPSFEVEDLLRIGEDGKGMISVLRLTDLQSKAKLFSTFMLCLLAEIYNTFPEQGDAKAPKLILFIDEAHLLFKEASKALLDQMESIIKLIRSKGVGIFFCTQNPSDIPDAILSQLGMKVQHALRAFTAKDRKMIKLTAQNYPISDYYKTDELLTSLGIGEAAITVLDEKGRPTPLSATLLRAPRSRMNILNEEEIEELVSKSRIARRYNEDVDRESAYEILNEKLAKAEEMAQQAEEEAKAAKKAGKSNKNNDDDSSWLEDLSKNPMARQLSNTIVREVTRGLMGVLGLGGSRRRSTRRWF